MPLVLVHNDVVANPAHRWSDVEGVQYHYPSKYQSKIKTGETCVYYRGVHRTEGKRGPAEYVGTGRIVIPRARSLLNGGMASSLGLHPAARRHRHRRTIAPQTAGVDVERSLKIAVVEVAAEAMQSPAVPSGGLRYGTAEKQIPGALRTENELCMSAGPWIVAPYLIESLRKRFFLPLELGKTGCCATMLRLGDRCLVARSGRSGGASQVGAASMCCAAPCSPNSVGSIR